MILTNAMVVEEGVEVGAGRTCGGLMTQALITQDDSEEWDWMKGAEDICYSALAAEPTTLTLKLRRSTFSLNIVAVEIINQLNSSC